MTEQALIQIVIIMAHGSQLIIIHLRTIQLTRHNIIHPSNIMHQFLTTLLMYLHWQKTNLSMERNLHSVLIQMIAMYSKKTLILRNKMHRTKRICLTVHLTTAYRNGITRKTRLAIYQMTHSLLTSSQRDTRTQSRRWRQLRRPLQPRHHIQLMRLIRGLIHHHTRHPIRHHIRHQVMRHIQLLIQPMHHIRIHLLLPIRLTRFLLPRLLRKKTKTVSNVKAVTRIIQVNLLKNSDPVLIKSQEFETQQKKIKKLKKLKVNADEIFLYHDKNRSFWISV